VRRLLRELFVALPRRAVLTLRYRGRREFLWRLLTFPLRPTPLRYRLGLPPITSDQLTRQRDIARRWYRRNQRPVVVVIPGDGTAARSVRKTTDPSRVRVLVVGGASFAAAVNSGLDAVEPEEDAVVLHPDVIAQRRWLETLQYAALRDSDAGIAAGKLLAPDGTIDSSGHQRDPAAPRRFADRYRLQPGDHAPAQVPVDLLAATGACMYLRREVLAAGIRFAEDAESGFEDIDLCLRAWESGRRVVYAPAATVVRASRSGGGSSGATFWRRWGDWLDDRQVRSPEGGLRIVYVTHGTDVGGGHRVVFEHLNGLIERGHDAELWTLGPPPDWFTLAARVRTFPDYGSLGRALEGEDALKVATWWTTAAPVWRASVRHGIPVYLVQDIETSYYSRDDGRRADVLASYRQEFRYLASSDWICERLRDLGLTPTRMAPGVRLDTFRPLGLSREPAMVLALGRGHPLKDLRLTLAAWKRLPAPRPRLRLFGAEPWLANRAGVEYVERPSDADVNRLYNAATIFVQTSRHEGFCLPLLEAMAAGTPVVCTDADGNRDFCRDGENCLLVDRTPEAVGAAIVRLLREPALRDRLGSAGQETARFYAWPERVAAVEEFFTQVAAQRPARAPG
jgi:glycosyltransferase involved in cell wall biosynthesis